MAQVYTRNFVDSCTSYLQNPGHVDTDNIHDDRVADDSSDQYDKHYFQLLIFEFEEDKKKKLQPKIVYGKKIHLLQYYFPKQYNDRSLKQLSCPTIGVKVHDKFVTPQDTEYPTIYFLLQCRKLSQLMAYTWLEDTKIDDKDDPKKAKKMQYVRRILNKYNILPSTCCLEEVNQNIEEVQLNDLKLKEYLLKIEKEEEGRENNRQKEEEQKEEQNQKPTRRTDLWDSFLIKPESKAYDSISLALLLSGNAYYRKKIEPQASGEPQYEMIRIQEPILSNYEIVWDNALDISWDSFYTTKHDISQAGMKQKPPYHKMIIGYPPKPHEFSGGSQEASEALENWAKAKDDYDDTKDTDQPSFYPRHYNKVNGKVTNKVTKEWRNKKIKCVLPPYHYIPVTCG